MQYYRNVLAVACFDSRGKEFWEFHKKRLRELGYSLLGKRLAVAFGIRKLSIYC